MQVSIKSLKKTATLIKSISNELHAFGGHCGAAAVAINEVCFQNKAKIWGVFNKALASNGIYIGHIYLFFADQGLCLDGDGDLVDESILARYAELDPDDEEYQHLMATWVGDSKNLSYYEEVAYFDLSANSGILNKFVMDKLDHNRIVLEKNFY